MRVRFPNHPAGEFLLGGVEWHVLTTGPSEVVGSARTDSSFFKHMDAAIALGEAAVKANPKDASARFFLGGAYGYEARYLALQEKWWDAYQKGKRGVGHLERVVKERPDYGDAYLGLGIYHYYADVLPSVLKFFSTFVGMNGDKKRGLEEMHRALREGAIVREEARFFLAEIYSSFEDDQWRAFEYSRSLRDEFPESELFVWLHARVLDELHLADLAEPEWRWLRERAQGPGQRGFVEYRLARTVLASGDFAGAAARLSDLVKRNALGSRRMTMWARVRLATALDFLGRHVEAMEETRQALTSKASSTATDLAEERLAAGRVDPSVLSLSELEEMARILKETGAGTEADLRRLEEKLSGPSRGLSGSKAKRFTTIALDLAEARLRRGDPEGCAASASRLASSVRDLPKEQKARLLRLRARAFARLGRRDEAIAELKTARPKADFETREEIDADRKLIEAGAPPRTEGVITPSISAPDRGELTLEVEWTSGGPSTRVPLALDGTRWVLPAPLPDGVRSRFVIDGRTRRLDPYAPRVVLVDDEAWCLYPKQTKSPPAKDSISK